MVFPVTRNWLRSNVCQTRKRQRVKYALEQPKSSTWESLIPITPSGGAWQNQSCSHKRTEGVFFVGQISIVRLANKRHRLHTSKHTAVLLFDKSFNGLAPIACSSVFFRLCWNKLLHHASDFLRGQSNRLALTQLQARANYSFKCLHGFTLGGIFKMKTVAAATCHFR